MLWILYVAGHATIGFYGYDAASACEAAASAVMATFGSGAACALTVAL